MTKTQERIAINAMSGQQLGTVGPTIRMHKNDIYAALDRSFNLIHVDVTGEWRLTVAVHPSSIGIYWEAVLHTDVVWELYTKKPMSHKHRLLKIISEWIQGKDPALKSINIRFVDVRPRSDIKLIRIKDETNV